MSDSYKSNNLYFTINKTQNSSEFTSWQKFRIDSFIEIEDYLIKEIHKFFDICLDFFQLLVEVQ